MKKKHISKEIDSVISTFGMRGYSSSPPPVGDRDATNKCKGAVFYRENF